MMLSALVPSICAAATLTPPRASAANGWKRANSVPKAPLPRMDCAGIDDDFRRVVLAGADDQVEHAIAIDIAHGDVDAAFISRETG